MHAAHSEGLRLRPATPKAPAHPGNSRFHSASGYHSVQFLAGNKRHARYDPARRFRINYAGPCSKYEDFSTPEEAALVIARRQTLNTPQPAVPSPRLLPLPVEEHAAKEGIRLIKSSTTGTGYEGVRLLPEGVTPYRKNRFRARLNRREAQMRGQKRDLGYFETAETAALAYARAMAHQVQN